MAKSFEITDEIFAKSVRDFTFVPENPLASLKYTWEPTQVHSFDRFENYNRIPYEENWVDSPEREEAIKKLGPPPTPQYNFRNRSNKTVDILTFLDPPGRYTRPPRLLIFIRGAPGSGKSWLANQILKKEAENGNTRCKFITANRYYNQRFIRDKMEDYQNNLHMELRETVLEGFYNLIIVEVEEGIAEDTSYYYQIRKMTELIGGYENYAIDIIQKAEVCQNYNIHWRGNNDIEKICSNIDRYLVTYPHNCIDPIEMVEPGWTERQQEKLKKEEEEELRIKKAEALKPRVRPPKPVRKTYSDDSDEECFTCQG